MSAKKLGVTRWKTVSDLASSISGVGQIIGRMCVTTEYCAEGGEETQIGLSSYALNLKTNQT